MRQPLRHLLVTLALLAAATRGPAALREPTYYGTPLSIWIARLKSTDVRTRKDAVEAIGEIGQRAPEVAPAAVLPALTAAFKDKYAEVRERVIAQLLGLRTPEKGAVVPLLIEALDDPSANVRADAALTLGELGPAAEKAVPKLAAMLKDKENVNHWYAARSLGRIGPGAAAAAPALAEALKDTVPVRRRATVALGLIGPDAKAAGPALVAVLKDPNEDIRFEAALALACIGNAAGRSILEGSTGHRATEGLVRLGPKQEPLRALKRDLYSDDLYVRDSAAETLARLGPEAKGAANALADCLKNETAHASFRLAASTALLRMGEHKDEAVAALIKLVRDDAKNNAEMRMSAIELLEQAGPDAKAAIPVLREAVKDRDALVWHAAARALRKIDPPKPAARP